jgi:hypothetical protein
MQLLNLAFSTEGGEVDHFLCWLSFLCLLNRSGVENRTTVAPRNHKAAKFKPSVLALTPTEVAENPQNDRTSCATLIDISLTA